MSIEVIIRGASAVPVLKSQTPPLEVVSEDDEAYIEWGSGPLGTVERNQIFDTDNFDTIDTNFPALDDAIAELPPTEPPTEIKQFVFDEIARQTHTVRITNPSDSAQYVDVEVIDQIAFNSVFGVYIYRFKNPL